VILHCFSILFTMFTDIFNYFILNTFMSLLCSCFIAIHLVYLLCCYKVIFLSRYAERGIATASRPSVRLSVRDVEIS